MHQLKITDLFETSKKANSQIENSPSRRSYVVGSSQMDDVPGSGVATRGVTKGTGIPPPLRARKNIRVPPYDFAKNFSKKFQKS